MTRFKLCEWEENGYDDSDGYVAFYNDETGTVGREETWSTRYARSENPPIFESPTREVVEKACAWLSNEIFGQLRAAEHKDVLEPNVVIGDRVKFLKSGTFKDKKANREVAFEAGEAGEVIWMGHFGTFYRNGYRQPGRHNGRIGVRLEDGRVVFVAMGKVRKAREPMSDAELHKRADRLALDCQFGKALSVKHAWDTFNWALEIVRVESLTGSGSRV
jgi:hypothetical protein